MAKDLNFRNFVPIEFTVMIFFQSKRHRYNTFDRLLYYALNFYHMILLCCFRSRRPVSVCRGDCLHSEGEEVLRADREGVWILQQDTAGTTCGRERTDGQDQVITERPMNPPASYCWNYFLKKLPWFMGLRFRQTKKTEV